MISGPVAQRIESVRKRIAAACDRVGRSPAEVTLIAVSKGFPAQSVRDAFDAGIRHFGENRVQEAASKAPELEDIRALVSWHMVGHLQTNKVKTAVRLFDTIHSVDSIHLADEISRRALASVPVFLEVNIAAEASKFGFSLEDLPTACEHIANLPRLDVRGLMTVAPLSSEPESARPIFRRLAQAARQLALDGLSMGMTDDFEIAIEEGATHVRIGRAIFGERP